MSHNQLSENNAKLHQTNRILPKVIPERSSLEEVKGKQEPIGRFKDRKDEKTSKKEGFKKGICIRCGDKWTKSHVDKRPANDSTNDSKVKKNDSL